MRPGGRRVSGLALLLVLAAGAAWAAPIEGRWQTVDLETGQPRGEVTLKLVDGVLEGHVTGGHLRPGETEASLCTKCGGALHKQPLRGLRVVWDMRAKDDERHYDGGRLLDPDRGSIYRAKLTLSPDGQRLEVRGYIGLPALGETTTWRRLPAAGQ